MGNIECVWNAFSSRIQFEKWYGPPHSTIRITSFNFTLHGHALISMSFANGSSMWEKWTYTEIKPLTCISCDTMVTDEHAQQPLDMGETPSSLINEFSFVPKDHGVEITLMSRVKEPNPTFLSSFVQNKPHIKTAWLSALQKIEPSLFA